MGGGFNAYVGQFWIDPARQPGDRLQYCFMPQPQHLNGGDALHGGFLMMLCDNILGSAAHSGLNGQIASTVTLNTDFLAAGSVDAPVFGGAEVTRQTRSLIFVSGELSQKGKVLMTATGIWKIIGA